MGILKNLILFFLVIFLATMYFGITFGITPAIVGGIFILLASHIGLEMGKELFKGMALSEEDLEIGSTYEIEFIPNFSSYCILAEIVDKDFYGDISKLKVISRLFFLPCIRDLNPIVGPKSGDKFKVTMGENGKKEIHFLGR